MTWHTETLDEKLGRLQTVLQAAQDELIEAEAELAVHLAEAAVFEREFEAKVGALVDELAAVEAEVEAYLGRIQARRNKSTFGTDYVPVEEQFRRAWTKPPPTAEASPPPPPKTAVQADLKKLYRRLARQYHPDLAENDEERQYRTAKMMAINEAYAAKDVAVLQALADDLEERQFRPAPSLVTQTKEELIQSLRQDIARCQHRLGQIRAELRSLHNRASVKLSLDVKFARRQGRDLLAEMAADLKKKIARKRVERDMIRAQFNDL